MDPTRLDLLAQIIQGTLWHSPHWQTIGSVSTDSRRIGNNTVFFALQGEATDGHRFVEQAFANGAVAAVVNRAWFEEQGASAQPIIVVEDTLAALQALAAWLRSKLAGKVVAVTGSNGKTIVKDALVQALQGSCFAAGSLGSYNSQLGVPLSLLRIPSQAEVAVIEAGVSTPGEMARLEEMLRPNCGILTNIGLAHIAAFGSREGIAQEKLRLFANIPAQGWLLAPANCKAIEPLLGKLKCRVYRFGMRDGKLPFTESRTATPEGAVLHVQFPEGPAQSIFVKTFSAEIITDIEAALCAAYLLGATGEAIAQALAGHEPAHTQMEIWRSPTGITLINDSCSSDPLSVEAALRALKQLRQPGGRGVFVFGGMQELGEFEAREHAHIGKMAARQWVDLLVLVGGAELEATAAAFGATAQGREVLHCENTTQLADLLSPLLYPGDTVLFKGPRHTGIDRAAHEIIGAMAYNRLIVDLQAVAENVACFRRLVGPQTEILGMVKALAYGTDMVRIAQELQNLGLDQLGVSTADEGMLLRRAGVTLPILVMLCTADEVAKAVQYHLTPVVYSAELVEPLACAANAAGRMVEVHLKVDSGMGRTGVRPEEVRELAGQVAATGSLKITGIMTHFACADDPNEDDFTRQQIEHFKGAVAELRALGHTELTVHAGATAGAARFPEAHFDMVRLGIGLYGIYPGPAVQESIELNLAVALVSRITEIRTYNTGDRIGYNGTYTVPRDGFRAGIIPFGYYDGLPVRLSNVGQMLVNGKPAPIVGRISMDSTIIDLTEVPDAQIGMEVLIYGQHHGHTLRPEAVAAQVDTIAYELLVRLGSRVQRVLVD